MEHFTQTINIDKPITTGNVIDVTDWGAMAKEGFCNTIAFRNAIDYCKENPGTILQIPKGVYHFYTTSDHTFIPLHDLTDITIDGCHSELIFHKPISYISIEHSYRIHLKNLVMDWAWDDAPLASVGVIKNMADDGGYLDFIFPSLKQVSEDMRIHIVGPFDPMRYTPGVKGGIEFRPYTNPHARLSDDKNTDNKMENLVRELSNILLPKMEKIDQNVVRMYTQNPVWAKEHFKVGASYNFRHFEYDTVAVRTTKSSHITYDSLTIYGCPGSGYLCKGHVHHLHFTHCVIMPRPGTARSISTSVDCLHVGNSNGYILIEHCDFSGAGDDCINLHDNSSMGIRRIDDHTILALRVSEEALQFEQGSEIEIRQPDLSPTGYRSRVREVTYYPESRECRLVLEDALPPTLEEESIIFNRSFGTNFYIIRNCRFTNNRARGLLLQGSHGIVENNLFENIQGAAIQIETGCESRWSEGQGVHDLLIQNNIIRHCDLNAWQMAVIYMGVYLPNGRTHYPIFSNIEIKQNTIIDCPRLACFLSSCKDISVHHNTIINAGQLDYKIANYGSSTMEKPIYDEQYEGIIQFAYDENCIEEDNQIFSLIE